MVLDRIRIPSIAQAGKQSEDRTGGVERFCEGRANTMGNLSLFCQFCQNRMPKFTAPGEGYGPLASEVNSGNSVSEENATD